VLGGARRHRTGDRGYSGRRRRRVAGWPHAMRIGHRRPHRYEGAGRQPARPRRHHRRCRAEIMDRRRAKNWRHDMCSPMRRNGASGDPASWSRISGDVLARLTHSRSARRTRSERRQERRTAALVIISTASAAQATEPVRTGPIKAARCTWLRIGAQYASKKSLTLVSRARSISRVASEHGREHMPKRYQ